MHEDEEKAKSKDKIIDEFNRLEEQSKSAKKC